MKQEIRIFTQDRHLAAISRDVAGPSKTCDFEGCNLKTREAKQFCPEHVEEHAYVRGIADKLAAIEKELLAVYDQGWEAIDVNGIRCSEILNHLRIHGSRTCERLLREVFQNSCDSLIVEHYARALREAKKVTVGHTTRGSYVVSIA